MYYKFDGAMSTDSATEQKQRPLQTLCAPCGKIPTEKCIKVRVSGNARASMFKRLLAATVKNKAR